VELYVIASYARLFEDIKTVLSVSSVIEIRLLLRPSKKTRFKCQRRANAGARLEARIARTTWGKNIAPYWELPNP
jgi:hypothetical protein